MQEPDPTPELSLPCGSHARKRHDKALARPLIEDVDILAEGGDGGMKEPSNPTIDLGPPSKQLGGKSIDKVKLGTATERHSNSRGSAAPLA